MNIEEILANKEFLIAKKKAEIQKSDYSVVLFDTAQKAFDSGIKQVEVLVYETTIDEKRNPLMYNQYKNGYVLNHSVGMRYVKVLFCHKNDIPEFTAENEAWEKYYPMVLNKEEADKKGYFWAVTEAKNIEGSAVVKGSNFLTPVLSMIENANGTISVKLAISPASIIDSHGDCHIAGLWKKSTNENNYNLLLQEHDMNFDKVISDSINNDFKVYTENIDIKFLLSKFTKKNIEPLKNTQKTEPSTDTQNKSISHLLI